ncbi:MAG: periplasmic heavy metal sensor [Pseudomonadota bacterium]
MTSDDDRNGELGSGEGADGAPPRRRWMGTVLVLSLAVNLLIFGAIGGMALRGASTDGDGLSRRERVLQGMLPPDHHDAWRQAVMEARKEKQEIRKGMQSMQQRIVSILRSEEFNPDELEQAFAERSAMRQELAGVTRRRLVVITSQMTPEDRTFMAERFEQLMARSRARREGREQRGAQ